MKKFLKSTVVRFAQSGTPMPDRQPIAIDIASITMFHRNVNGHEGFTEVLMAQGGGVTIDMDFDAMTAALSHNEVAFVVRGK